MSYDFDDLSPAQVDADSQNDYNHSIDDQGYNPEPTNIFSCEMVQQEQNNESNRQQSYEYSPFLNLSAIMGTVFMELISDSDLSVSEKATRPRITGNEIYNASQQSTLQQAIMKPSENIMKEVFFDFQSQFKPDLTKYKQTKKFKRARKCTDKWFKAICSDSQARSQFVEFLDEYHNQQKTKLSPYQIRDAVDFCYAAVHNLQLWKLPYTPKNLPHTIGNNFQKWVKKQRLPQNDAVREFVQRKVRGKQVDYEIENFAKLCLDPYGQQELLRYLKNYSHLDLLKSTQIVNPEEIFPYIDVCIRGAQNPTVWNGHYNLMKKVK